MSILLTCLAIALLMPYLAKAPLIIAMAREGSGYDNKHPREQQARLTSFGARAHAAHENSFESLIVFTPCLLAVIATGQTGGMASYAAIGYLLARAVYLLCYWLNWDRLRSTVWLLSMIACGVLLAQAWPR